ncbi:hypothetical protein K458DRAFT_384115 [Lentithecium fluviatile CBS 122367]|uniref:Uncharacterized protein n=1 Tax=Lentithecium fluviatile CBS 122367 TaxID=1168545 RepID=A0A6G1JH50_9PLEO|nr:hypothetical protein K458DRAFT_384115 [Lentithecium fluviatile CBS 122367]
MSVFTQCCYICTTHRLYFNNPHILPANQIQRQHFQEITTIPNQTAKPSMIVRAEIRDLSGNAIRPGQPMPIHRRTSSGHLFKPKEASVPSPSLSSSPLPAPAPPSAPGIHAVDTVRALLQPANIHPFSEIGEHMVIRSSPAKTGSVVDPPPKLSVRRTEKMQGGGRGGVLRRKGRMGFNAEGLRRRSCVGHVGYVGCVEEGEGRGTESHVHEAEAQGTKSAVHGSGDVGHGAKAFQSPLESPISRIASSETRINEPTPSSPPHPPSRTSSSETLKSNVQSGTKVYARTAETLLGGKASVGTLALPRGSVVWDIEEVDLWGETGRDMGVKPYEGDVRRGDEGLGLCPKIETIMTWDVLLITMWRLHIMVTWARKELRMLLRVFDSTSKKTMLAMVVDVCRCPTQDSGDMVVSTPVVDLTLGGQFDDKLEIKKEVRNVLGRPSIEIRNCCPRPGQNEAERE